MADPPPSPCHTRPSNADKHPADILKPEKKRCTKAEKAADDKWLKEEKAAHEKVTQGSLEELAAMEVDAEMKEADTQAFRPQPVHPRPRPHAKGVASGNAKAPLMHDGEGNKKAVILVPLSSPAPDGQGMAVGNDPDVQKIQPQPLVSLKETLREAKVKRLAKMKAMLHE